MTDLILQNYRDLPVKNLKQILANEKQKMLGEQKSHLKKKGADRSPAGSFAKTRKVRTSR